MISLLSTESCLAKLKIRIDNVLLLFAKLSKRHAAHSTAGLAILNGIYGSLTIKTREGVLTLVNRAYRGISFEFRLEAKLKSQSRD